MQIAEASGLMSFCHYTLEYRKRYQFWGEHAHEASDGHLSIGKVGSTRQSVWVIGIVLNMSVNEQVLWSLSSGFPFGHKQAPPTHAFWPFDHRGGGRMTSKLCSIYHGYCPLDLFKIVTKNV